MAATIEIDPLSPELLQMQLDTISLIRAMYSREGELTLDDRSVRLVKDLEGTLADGTPLSRPLDKLSVAMKLDVEISSSPAQHMRLNISLPMYGTGPSPYEPPSLIITLERPAWLSKKAFDLLVQGSPRSSPDVLSETIEYIQTSVLLDCNEDEHGGSYLAPQSERPLVRVWFYFPSLSTREKRHDLVTLAPTYGLTGFVLAGKPGVLCLEGIAEDIQAYVADIKRNSWSDIPSFQKKITERFREEDNVERKFVVMSEITDDIEKHGQRGNRGDLSQVEKFLETAGLAAVFGPVFMQKT